MKPIRTPQRSAAPPRPHHTRARIAALCCAIGLSACASAPAPQWVRLPAATPPHTPEVNAPKAAASPPTWQLMLPVRLPDYLDRDALLVPQGQAGLQALPGYRWAEPLRESVPRLLRQDLAALLGESQVWTAPLPPGLLVQHQLRVELLELQADAERLSVLLRARRVLAVDASAHEARAPEGSQRYRAGDLRKRALTQPDALAADVLLHPEFGYYVSFTREFRERAIAAGYQATMGMAERIKALHAG